MHTNHIQYSILDEFESQNDPDVPPFTGMIIHNRSDANDYEKPNIFFPMKQKSHNKHDIVYKASLVAHGFYPFETKI